MEKVTNIQNTNNIVSHSQNSTPVIAFRGADYPADSVEISTNNKKPKKKCWLNVAGMLSAAAAVVGGATFGGVKIYEKYFQKLASGVKRGEIRDELFNFIKRTDPNGELFNDRNGIITINNELSDENFVILKQLSKMKNVHHRIFYPNGDIDYAKRFSLKDMTELLKTATKDNIEYLAQLAQKSEKSKFGSYERTWNAGEIIPVLRSINADNKVLAEQLIQKAEIDNNGKLIRCLEKINKDNVEYYKLVMSTRQNSGLTELEFNDMNMLVEKIKEFKNPESAKLFLDVKKADGTGEYLYAPSDITSLLSQIKDTDLSLYKKLHGLDSVKKAKGKEIIKHIIPNVTEENLPIVDKILSAQYEDGFFKGTKMLFGNWDKMGKVLKNTNSKNIEFIDKLIDCAAKKDSNIVCYMKDGKLYSGNFDDAIIGMLKEFKIHPEKFEKAQEILDLGLQANKKTVDIGKICEQLGIMLEKSKY